MRVATYQSLSGTVLDTVDLSMLHLDIVLAGLGAMFALWLVFQVIVLRAH